MMCPECGTQNEEWSNSCVKCGNELVPGASDANPPTSRVSEREFTVPMPEPPPLPLRSPEPGRGTLILVLGILGIILVPFLGIAAWIMGKRDLGKIASGRIPAEAEGSTKTGMILGIVGTGLSAIGVLFVLIGIVVGISLISNDVASVNRKGLTDDLTRLSVLAQAYYRNESSVTGGKGTFTGIRIEDLAHGTSGTYTTGNGTYSIEVGGFGQGPIKLVGVGRVKNSSGELIRVVMAVWPDSAAVVENN